MPKNTSSDLNTYSNIDLQFNINGNSVVEIKSGVKQDNYDDVSINSRNEDQVNLANALLELQRSNTELRGYAHMCAHDLREPLRVISGFVQLLLRHNSGQFDATSIEYITFILRSLGRMDVLISDVLNFATISERQRSPERIDIQDVLNAVKETLHFRFMETNASLILHQPFPVLKGDRVQIRQVFMNLVENAIKYRGAQPPKIEISVMKVGNFAHISLSDNGMGIDPDFHQEVFTMFKRVTGNKREHDGTGIGLTLCKKIVESHGGNIRVENNAAGGCVFKFALPLDESEISA